MGRALILALLLWPAVASAQLAEPVEGGYSPVAARYQWGSTGGDFPLPAGSTVLADCSGAALQAGAACAVGEAWTVGGAPALVPSYWRPGGGVAGSAVLLGGGASVTSPSLTYGTMCKRGRTAAGVAEVACTAGETTGAILLDSGAVERVVVIAEVLDAAAITRVQRASFAQQGSLGEPLTVTGPATSAVLTKADGSPFVAVTPANTPSIVAGGVQVYPARISRVLYNQRSSANTANGGICGVGSKWTVQGTATCALSPVAAPDGSMTAERITVGTTTSGNYILQSPTGFTASAALGVSVWIRRVSSTGTLRALHPGGGALYGEFRADLSSIGGEWVQLRSGGVYQTTAWAASGTGGGGIALAALADTVTLDVVRVWQQEGMLGPDAEVQASPLSVAATSLETPIPAGSLSAIYTLGGVRTVLDLTGNTSPLAIGAGKELDASGVFGSLLFCRSPVTGDCQ